MSLIGSVAEAGLNAATFVAPRGVRRRVAAARKAVVAGGGAAVVAAHAAGSVPLPVHGSWVPWALAALTAVVVHEVANDDT